MIVMFVSDTEPEPQTLVAAKSRGRLINLNKDGKVMFESFENMFRSLFPTSVFNVSMEKYIESCLSDEIVQDCFHNATDSSISGFKDKVLLDMICLFFKVRVHQKCRVIVDNVRGKQKASSKEKALRSKLAK